MLLILTFATPAERDKFEYLYHKYKNLCLKKAYDILRDYSLAEDAVSEAFLRIYKNLDKIEDPDSNRSIAFVVTVARNAALTLLSKEKKQDSDELDEAQEDSFNLEQMALSNLSLEGIYGLLEQINEDLRSVFTLKFAYDLSHREIAGLLGITENNVTVRLHRAKKKLAQLLVKEGYVSADSK